jgi:uncharacterized protein YbgA (DUF1722 family)
MNEKIKLGISHCLLGANVRWNGGHTKDHFLADIFGQYVEYVPVCPEIEIGLRENFIVRVFTYYRWQQLLKEGQTVGGLVNFHTRNKLLFMAHHPEMAREMGKLTAKAKQIPTDELFTTYLTLMMKCLKYRSTPRKNANVLYHMVAYLKDQYYLNPHPMELKLRNHA